MSYTDTGVSLASSKGNLTALAVTLEHHRHLPVTEAEIMATPIVVGDVMQLRLCQYITNQIGLNLVHYRITAITGTPTVEAAATPWDGLWAPLYKPLMSNAARWRGLGVRRLNPNPTIEYSAIANDGPGTSVTDPMSKVTCGIITKVTGFPGRGNRGRMYLSFPSEGLNDVDGTPTNAYVVALGVLSALIVLDQVVTGPVGSTATWRPVIRHRVSGTTLDITIAQSRKKWASQHRRGDYGRPNVLPF